MGADFGLRGVSVALCIVRRRLRTVRSVPSWLVDSPRPAASREGDLFLRCVNMSDGQDGPRQGQIYNRVALGDRRREWNARSRSVRDR